MNFFKKIIKSIGPGYITGASDDDPTAIVTYSQSGGQFGYQQLWTTLFTIPFMVVVQEMCGRIGIVTGKGLGTIMSIHYPKAFVWSLLVIVSLVNVITIGADLGAMAATAQLLWNIAFFIWLIGITIIILGLQVFVPYRFYVNILKYSSLIFLSYVISAFMVKQSWREILHNTFLPHVIQSRAFFLNMIAILGTNISPYLFFWQTSQEVEEEVIERKISAAGKERPDIRKSDVTKMYVDTVIGMIFSNAIVFFVELVTAATLGVHHMTTVNTPQEAVFALKPFAGQFAFLLFSAGIIGSGFLAIPVLTTSSAYAFCGTFKWRQGLQKKFFDAPMFYLLIAIFTLSGVTINLLHIKPFDLLVYAAACNGIITPLLLGIILHIANNKSIMYTYTNSILSNFLGITITVLSIAASLTLIFFYVHK